MKTLSEQLHEHFQRSGETKTDFAKRARVSTMSVTRAMNNEKQNETTLERIADGLKRYKAVAPNNIVPFESDTHALSLLSTDLRNLADHIDSASWPNDFKVEKFAEFVSFWHTKLDSLRVLTQKFKNNP